jgi:CheY-like chemotaxis protein
LDSPCGAKDDVATILVVEDRPIDREFLVTLLGYAGHTTLEAGDGLEALALVWAKGADLIVTDILMPTMDGFEFIRRLRANPATAQVPVILYSATYRHREARALAQAAGGAHILFKPAEPGVILDTVSLVLKQPPPAPAQPTTEGIDDDYVRALAEKLRDRAERLSVVNLKLHALVQISRQLPDEEHAPGALEQFCLAARALVGARLVGIGILHPDGQRLRQFFLGGVDGDVLAAIRPPLAHQGVFGRLLAEHMPVRLSDFPPSLFSASFPPEHPPVHSFLGVPILSSKQAFGWLYFCDRMDAEPFDEEDERVALVLAAQAALAYEAAGR